MLVNLFFFTITISKRKYSSDEIEKAYEMNKIESHIERSKSKQFEQMKFL
ncbi:YrzI family small protein [Anaerobacillus alkaliphilus]|nr:YrzI family small protein [Anaerobacillus alkaliphilus]